MKNYSVLVVEDDEGLGALIKRSLRKNGFNVYHAETGEEALKIAEKDEKLIALLDFRLPDMTGKEIIEVISKKEKPIPFIIMTVYGDEKTAVEMMKLGAIDYLIKDSSFLEFLPEVLSRSIEELERDEKLKSAERQLVESEEKFRTAFHISPDAILMKKISNQQIVEVNSSFTDIFGFERDEVIDIQFEALNIWPDKETYTKLIENLNLEGILLSQENHLQKKDGSQIIVLISASTMMLHNEKHLLIMMRDITKRVKLEELVMESEKLHSISGLAAGTAHELNNPLAGIMQSAAVIKQRISKDLPANKRAADECSISIDQLRKYFELREINSLLESIHDSGKKAAKIVMNMLEFSQESETELNTVNINELLDKSLELAASDYTLVNKYNFKEITIVKEYEDDIPQILCASGKIQQVFLNIIKNCAQAMSSAKYRELKLKICKESIMLKIIINDNGPGMEEIIKRHIFEPFYSTRDIGEGSGLGMAVAYSIITQTHNGDIRIETEKGIGTSFIIRLPYMKEEKYES